MKVLAMLDEAKRLIDEGRMTPEELDRNLLINLQVRTAQVPFARSLCAGRCAAAFNSALRLCHTCNPASTS